MKFLLTTKSLTGFTLSNLPFQLQKGKMGDLHYVVENSSEIFETESVNFFMEGYIRNFNFPAKDVKKHVTSGVEEIAKDWPLKDNFTGSFSVILHKKQNGEIIICNDLIGVYPVYYLIFGEELYISNSIILMALISNCDFDEVGIIQRSIGPEYSNFGSRTILKNCKRLLSGEYISILGKKIVQKKYDNSLYQNISSQSQQSNLHLDYWEAYKKELKYALIDFQNVNIALSGGLDSRLLLGAIPKAKNIKCLTYGEKDYYETKVARKLAKRTKADFQSFSDLALYFPSIKIFAKHHLKTEAVLVCSWLEILENVKLDDRKPLLLGDMTEGLAGRNIKKFSSRKFRQQNFYKYHIQKKDYSFQNSGKETFKNWIDGIVHNYDRWYTENRIGKFKFYLSREKLVQGLHHDLQEVFTRIEAHHLPYSELYDELFLWYTHSRIPMSKQILICNSDFYSYCPPMSMQVLRMTSNIHPNLRLSNRFLNKLFRLPELKELNTVPTSQAPLIPQNFPDLLKMPVWGIRSKIDHYLIKRLVKSRNAKKRYRLFRSLNWPLIYQNRHLEKNIHDYFSPNCLGEGQFEHLRKRATERKELIQWPFGNTEIISNASLNFEINTIKRFK